MRQFTAIVHRGETDEGGFWASCLEVPGANGQGETKEECLGNLKEAIQLLLDTGREEAFRLDPQAETTQEFTHAGVRLCKYPHERDDEVIAPRFA